jgi:hypothetical protein
MKKLYRVTIEQDVVVAANTPHDAVDWVRQHHAQIDDEASYAAATQIDSVDDLPEGYNGACLPWGDDDDRPISAYFKQGGTDET